MAQIESRPTNEWEIYFDNNGEQSSVIIEEADDIHDALAKFQKEYGQVRVYSAAQRSYVQSTWIEQE